MTEPQLDLSVLNSSGSVASDTWTAPLGGAQPRHRWRSRLPVLVFAVGLVLTGFGAWDSRRQQRELHGLKEEQSLNAVSNALQGRLAEVMQLSEAFAGLHQASTQVSNAEFQEFFQNLQRSGQALQGTYAIQFLSGDPTTGTARVAHIEPMSRLNRVQVGRNRWAEPVLRAVLERASREGHVELSAPYGLGNGLHSSDRIGLAVATPVGGRHHPRGWVLTEVRVNDLVLGALSSRLNLIGQALDLQIVDVTDPARPLLAFSSLPQVSTVWPPHSISQEMEVGGRTWRVAVHLPERPDLAWLVFLLSGALASSAVALLVRWLLRQNAHTLAALARADAAMASRQQAFDQLRISAEAFRLIEEGVVITDRNGRFLAVNAAYCQMVGLREEHLLGTALTVLERTGLPMAVQQKMWQELLEKGSWKGESWERRASTETFPVYLRMRVVDGLDHHTGTDEGSGATQGSGWDSGSGHVLITVSDLSTLQQKDEQLERLSYHDHLTDLPNLRMMELSLEQAIRSSEDPIQVIWIDLDGLKRINDSFGREQGDQLLAAVVARFQQVLPPGDLLGRIGGDEFLVLHRLQECRSDLLTLPERLLETLHPGFGVGAETITLELTGCLGASLFPDQSRDGATLLQFAATALNEAKRSGPDTLRLYSPEMTESSRRRLALEIRLQRSLDRGEGLYLLYQPQVDPERRLVGCEALLRWRCDDFGDISPAEFVPIAEASGLIQRLGAWVIQQGCRQQAQWKREGLNPPRLAINVSSQQFSDPRKPVAELIRHSVEAHGLDPAELEVEITESCLIPGAEAEQQIRALAARGHSIAVDDFGTGYSSLSVLSKFPIAKLKIDQSFVQGIDLHPSLQEIVRATVMMAQGLEIRTLAEGVERPEELEVLRSYDCLAYQGYLFSKPISAADYGALLASVAA